MIGTILLVLMCLMTGAVFGFFFAAIVSANDDDKEE